MTATTLAIEPPASLDTFTGDLVLRISGSSRDGQIVRLRSAKCTIGSAPHCTLRLVARGVAPLHCLLLRGPAATIARCWSSDTRLNDTFFSDAVLSSNDRLSIGPIELQVLDVGATSPVEVWDMQREELQRAASRQREQLAARSAELEAEGNALAAQRDDLETQRNALADDRWQWQARQEEIQRQIAEQREQLASRLAELEPQANAFAAERGDLEARRNALAEEQRQWQAQQAEIQQNIDRQREQLKAQLAELELRRSTLIDEPRQTDQEAGRKIDEQCEQVDAQLAELQSQRNALAIERDGLQAQQNQLAEDRRQWHTRQEDAQREIEGQREQLAARAAELESQRNALAAERNALDAQRSALAEHRQQSRAQYEENQRAINEQREQLAAQLAGLESQWNAVGEESRQWQAKQQENQRAIDEQQQRLVAQSAKLESQHNALAAERDSLETQRNALAEERRQWQAQQEAEAQQTANTRQAQIDAQLAEIESQHNALAAERDSLEAQRNALGEERRQWELQRIELPPQEQVVVRTEPSSAPSSQELPAATVASPETPEPQFEAPAPQSPVDLHEVFRRIGAKLNLCEEEQTPPTLPSPAPMSPSRNAPRSDATGHAPQQAVALSAAKADEEESIDDYMSRLMRRVGSSTGEADAPSRAGQRPEPPRPRREASAVPTATEPTQPVSQTSPPPEQPEPVQARARTTPTHIDLSAFRELANFSARHAIQQHSRRTLVHAMYSKLTVMVVALLASVGLFWTWKEYGACRLTLYSSLVAIGVAIFWGLEYAFLTGRLIVNNRGHVNIDWKGSSHHGGGDVASAESAAAESPTAEDAHSSAEPS
jgi:chromosome segregation ATPase